MNLNMASLLIISHRRNLGNLVCLEGIITKCSLVRPKVVKSVHFCPATGKTMERVYSDLTSVDAYPSTAAYPTQVTSSILLVSVPLLWMDVIRAVFLVSDCNTAAG